MSDPGWDNCGVSWPRLRPITNLVTGQETLSCGNQAQGSETSDMVSQSSDATTRSSGLLYFMSKPKLSQATLENSKECKLERCKLGRWDGCNVRVDRSDEYLANVWTQTRGKLVAVAVTSVSCNSQSKVHGLKRNHKQTGSSQPESAGAGNCWGYHIVLTAEAAVINYNRQRMNEIVKYFDGDSTDEL